MLIIKYNIKKIKKWRQNKNKKLRWSGSALKNLPAKQEQQEMWVQPLSQEDPMEKEIATHSSILAWRITWMEKDGRLQSIGSQSLTRL